MRVFVTGLSGMLGHALAEALLAAGHEVSGSGTRAREALLLPSVIRYTPYRFAAWEVDELGQVVGDVDAVVHAAAYTKVDLAEQDPLEAHRANALYAQAVARVCEIRGLDLLYVSSDYVFDGRAQRPYREWDQPNPLGVYGQSKLAGENAVRRIPRHYVVRTSWLYGLHGPNFVTTIIKAARERPELRVVDDQHGSPTLVDDLATAIAALLGSQRYGIYHLTNQGAATWCGFAREILRQVGCSTPVHPQSTAEAARPAPRPAYSVLDNWAWRVAGEAPLPAWQDALARFLVGLQT